jgi:hypothetical protein
MWPATSSAATPRSNPKAMTAGKLAARSHGATVVKSLASTMLLDLEPARVPEVALALPG